MPNKRKLLLLLQHIVLSRAFNLYAYSYGWQLFLLLVGKKFSPKLSTVSAINTIIMPSNLGYLKFNIHSLTVHVRPQESRYVIIVIILKLSFPFSALWWY